MGIKIKEGYWRTNDDTIVKLDRFLESEREIPLFLEPETCCNWVWEEDGTILGLESAVDEKRLRIVSPATAEEIKAYDEEEYTDEN